MKHIAIAVLAVAMLSGTSVYAKDKAVVPAAGLKITRITGTVQLMKDGLVVMTLKPGDALPSLVDANMSFNVVSGSIEVEAGGEKIIGGSGSNFTVNAEKNGEVKINVAAGAPVEIKGARGSSIVLAQNTDVKMTNNGAKMDIAVEKGSAIITTASGATPQTVNTGETASMPVSVIAPGAPAVVADTPAATEEPAATEPVVIPPFVPETTVIETQTIQESCEVSGSTPGCNP